MTDKLTGRSRRGGNNPLDARGPRAFVCVIAAVAIWFGFAAGFVRGLWQADDVRAPKPVALDVQLVRLPAPQPPPPAQPTPQTGARAANTPRTPPTPSAPPTPARVARQSIVRTPAAPAQSRERSEPAATATPPPVAPGPQPVPPTPSTPQPAAPAANTAPTPAPAAAHTNAPQPNGPATPATSATDSSSASAGNGPAHPILQPLPSLPDDLREDAFQAVATARFSIHRDGSVDVELIKPTHNPRVNQLLLDTLKKWRFFPAMKNGEAVESTQDIRVHVNVD